MNMGGPAVLLTQSKASVGPFVEAFQASGVRAVSVPLIGTEAVPEPHVRETARIVFVSAEAVRRLPDGCVTPETQFAAVGEATAAAVRARFGTCHLVSPGRDAGDLLSRICEIWSPGDSDVLLPRAAEGRTLLETGLTAAGFTATACVLYRTVALSPEPPDSLAWDAVALCSPSAVRAWLAWGDRPDAPRTVSIGPTTSAAMRSYGLTVDAEASQPNPAQLVQAFRALKEHTPCNP